MLLCVIVQFVASIGPGVFIIAASYSGCDRMLAVAMFTVAMGFMGTFYCGMKVNGLDLSPNYAGTVMAIVNGLGALSGIITPYLVGALTEDVSSCCSLSRYVLVLCVENLYNFLYPAYFKTVEIGLLDFTRSFHNNDYYLYNIWKWRRAVVERPKFQDTERLRSRNTNE